VSRNIHEPTPERATQQNRFGVKMTHQKPLASRWVEPDCATPGDDCPDFAPTLANSWAQPSAPLEKFAFRKHMDGSLEFKGHLDASGATSGTVAFTLPGFTDGEPDYTLPNDQYFHTVITPDDGTTFQIALVFIDSTTGDVTITWPAS
jgi:hypothetical protein